MTTPYPQKGDTRAFGVRDVVIYCRDHRCSHHVEFSADRWPNHVRLSNIEPGFTCTRCTKRGASRLTVLAGPAIRLAFGIKAVARKLEGAPTRERLLRAERGGFHIGGDQRSTRVYRMTDAPIERALAAGQLSEDQFEALQQLWANWHFGRLDGGLRSIDLDRVSCGAVGEPANGGLRAAKFHAAWQRLEPDERDIVSLVVLAEHSLKHAGMMLLGFRSPFRAKEAALRALQAAADRLAGGCARQSLHADP